MAKDVPYITRNVNITREKCLARLLSLTVAKRYYKSDDYVHPRASQKSPQNVSLSKATSLQTIVA